MDVREDAFEARAYWINPRISENFRFRTVVHLGRSRIPGNLGQLAEV